MEKTYDNVQFGNLPGEKRSVYYGLNRLEVSQMPIWCLEEVKSVEAY